MTGRSAETLRRLIASLVLCGLATGIGWLPGPHPARGGLGDSSLSVSLPSAAAVPFAQGERFTYALSWFAIQAGTAVMEVGAENSHDGDVTYKMVTTARSNDFISAFYPVANKVESWFDGTRLVPRRMMFHRREGKRKNDFDVTFHHQEGKVVSVKDGVTRSIDIPSGTQDALSCLYYLRTVPDLVPGTSLWMEVHHDQKNYRLEIRVEGVEKLSGPWGEREALRVLAVMPFKGIFLNQGNIRVWLTNDSRRIPLMMQAKIIIGSVWAQLIEGSDVPARD